MRVDLAGDRVKQTEFTDLESIAVEATSEGEKWLFVGACKPPNMSDTTFNDDFKINTDKICKNYDNFMIMGNMNFNMLDEQRSSVLNDLCDIFCLQNLVKKPTCYTCNAKPTLLDVILTNQENKCGKLCNFGTGLSNVHNFIAVQVKCARPLHNPKYRNCRSF